MTSIVMLVQKSDRGTRRVQTQVGAGALVSVRNPTVNADNLHTAERSSLCPF